MIRHRVPETDTGITGDILVSDYDEMQKNFVNEDYQKQKK